MSQTTEAPAQPGAHSPRDVIPGQPGPRPQMTRQDANFNVHVAGMRAAEEAEKTGVSPQQADALLDAAAGGRIIGGVKFPPIHASLLLLLPQLDGFKTHCPALASEAVSLMGIAYCVLKPAEARATIRAKDGEKFEEEMYAIAEHLTLPQLKELGEWIADQMKLLNGDADAGEAEAPEKKSLPTT